MENKNIILENINIYQDISFSVKYINRNYDLYDVNDTYNQYYNGEIKLTRVNENKLPKIIGEFSMVMWNLSLMSNFDDDPISHINLEEEEIYYDLQRVLNDRLIDLNKYDKLIFVTNLLLIDEYKKIGLSEELFEFLYKSYYNKNTLILSLVKPLQEMVSEFKYYSTEKTIKIKSNVRTNNPLVVSVGEYYNLNELYKLTDDEINQYKLFNKATKIGLSRVGETNIFKFFPKNTIDRINYKNNELVIITENGDFIV